MRLRLVLPFAALLALAACDQPASKSGVAARAPLPATMPATACPPTPACLPQTAKASGGQKARAHKAVAHRSGKAAATKRSTVRHTAYAAPAGRYEYRRAEQRDHDDLAGGPPPRERFDDRGGRYEERRYDDRRDSGVRVYGGPSFHERDEVYSDRRYQDGHAYRGQAQERRYERAAPADDGQWYEDGRRRYAPPPPVRYRDETPRLPTPDRYSGGHSYHHQESGRTAGGVYGERSRSESYSESETHRSYSSGGAVYESRSSVRGPCCVASPGAAGLDGNGFLTWPGKVPARP